MAKNRELKRAGSDDVNLTKAQDYIAEFVQPIQNSRIWQGVLIKSVSLSTGSVTLLEHKLNRDPQGWTIVSKNAQSDVWENKTNVIRKRFIGLECSANVVVDIWIF